MAEQEPPEARAEGARALDELFLLDREHLRARLPGDADPAGEPDRDEDVEQPGAERRHDQDDEQQARERVHDVDEAGEEQVDASAQVSGQGADRHPDQHDDDLRPEPDDHRHARTVDHPGEHVAAELIGAERVVARGRLVEAAEIRLGVRVRAQDVGEDRDQDQHDHDTTAGHREPILPEPPERVASETRRDDRLASAGSQKADRGFGTRRGGGTHVSTLLEERPGLAGARPNVGGVGAISGPPRPRRGAEERSGLAGTLPNVGGVGAISGPPTNIESAGPGTRMSGRPRGS